MKYTFSSQRKKVYIVIYLSKTFTELNKCKNTPRDFVKTFKNYASYIHIFSLTDNFQNSRKKRKKEEKNFPYMNIQLTILPPFSLLFVSVSIRFKC